MEDEENMLKVKICGITNLEDASLAVQLGADMLGFIFASSPRRTSPEVVKDILSQVPPFAKSVGVFVDEDPEVIRETINFCGIDMVQLHGNESPEFCNQFMPAAIKALRVKDESILQSVAPYKGKVKALLLDTYSEKIPGGTGKSFDWELAIRIREMGIPIILAGGLGPSNIEDAISTVQPYAVDLVSGIEEKPGKKSKALMEELFEKITRIRSQEIEKRKGKRENRKEKRGEGRNIYMYGSIKHFTDIEAWKLAHELRIAVYKIIKKLPTEEKYDLVSQMRRAAISCTANIAEGYGRFHYQENIQFCRISRGSMYEIQDHLITCLDNEYISKELYDKIWNLSMNAIKVLDGYIRYLKKKE